MDGCIILCLMKKVRRGGDSVLVALLDSLDEIPDRHIVITSVRPINKIHLQ
jgi:hypothetical protein